VPRLHGATPASQPPRASANRACGDRLLGAS